MTDYPYALEAAYQVVDGADWLQTRWIATHGGWTYRATLDPQGNGQWVKESWGFTESNPMLGQHPSESHVDRYFAASAALHALVTGVLPARFRQGWEWLSIGFEGAMVAHNVEMKINFQW